MVRKKTYKIMEGSRQSFSIDALLSRDSHKPKSRVSPPPPPALQPHHPPPPPAHRTETANRPFRPASPLLSPPLSPTSSRSDEECNSPTPSSSSARSPSYLPRSGLTAGIHPGLYPMGNSLYYNGHGGGGVHHPFPFVNAGAFQNPGDRLKAAQQAAHGMPVEWLARAGLFLPRMMEYAGEKLFSNFAKFSFNFFHFFRIFTLKFF